MRTVALIVGTRPEAIKMAPVYQALRASTRLRPVLLATAQHCRCSTRRSPTSASGPIMTSI